MNATPSSPWASRGQRFLAALVRFYHFYGSWLIGISWLRFIVLGALLIAAAALLQELPPFSWKVSETVSHSGATPRPAAPPRAAVAPAPARPPAPAATPQAETSSDKPREPIVKIEAPRMGEGVDISIDERGVRITPKRRAAAPPDATASAAPADEAASEGAGLHIKLPPGAQSDSVRQAVEEARRAIEEAVRDAKHDAEQARADAQQALEDARQAARDAGLEVDEPSPGKRRRTKVVQVVDFLPNLALLWVLASALLKFTYKRQVQAEAQAAQAVETAEAESLKRQVVEARMAAMQAQIEPHFLFNTLASIDHLIEVDPKRASQMQKNLIALLRASMPSMRDTSDGGLRDLGRELAVIRPYLEILKVRMEERLTTRIDVPEGLLSAEFPSMMLQTLVENAIKHGLEPKPEGGALSIAAQIVHGKLAVSVADTGLGFGRAATAGTGVGLANIRERLQMLFGPKALLTIAENPGGGTLASISVPYKPVQGADA